MKVLWLTNVILPQVATAIGLPVSAFGGWLDSMSQELSANSQIEFHTCFAAPQGLHFDGVVDNIHYHSFTRHSVSLYCSQNEAEFIAILRQVQPDIIHIFGTEYAHTLAMVNACQSCNLLPRVVISIQGLVSICAQHYCAYLPNRVIHRKSFRDWLKRSNIANEVKDFARRGKNEIAALQKVLHVIGRTDWDEACVTQINPNITYHFCNESLRKSFYEHTWSLANCQKHSLFVSQFLYPIKGFHLMLEALKDIVKKYPDAILYTTGSNPLQCNLSARLRQNGYTRYIAKTIRKYHLENNVVFLGTLNEQAMAEQYLKTHVFISPSSIENSPNSVAEAMLLGVPVISSDVGGVKNLLTHGTEGFLYPADEPYMITHYVSKIFENDDLAQQLSRSAQIHASQTHHKKDNFSQLHSIYNCILQHH